VAGCVTFAKPPQTWAAGGFRKEREGRSDVSFRARRQNCSPTPRSAPPVLVSLYFTRSYKTVSHSKLSSAVPSNKPQAPWTHHCQSDKPRKPTSQWPPWTFGRCWALCHRMSSGMTMMSLALQWRLSGAVAAAVLLLHHRCSSEAPQDNIALSVLLLREHRSIPLSWRWC
jgi:hypothetical protein